MERTTLVTLPDPVLVHVVSFLSPREAVRAAGAARACFDAVRSPTLWSAFARAAYGRHFFVDYPYEPPARDVSGRLFLDELRATPEFVEGALNARLWAFAPRRWPMWIRRRETFADRAPTHEFVASGLYVARYPRQPRRGYEDFCVRGNAPFDIYGKPEPFTEQDWIDNEYNEDVEDPCKKGDCTLPVRRLVCPSPRGGWRSATGAYFEVAIRREEPTPVRWEDFGGRSSGALMSVRWAPPRPARDAAPCVAVGLCTDRFNTEGKQPGWTRTSYGYHGDDGKVYHGGGESGQDFGFPTFGAGDVVGCGQCRTFSGGSAVYFTLNGRCLGISFGFRSSRNQKLLYPVVGMDDPSLACEVNFGFSRDFVFQGRAAMERFGMDFHDVADLHRYARAPPPGVNPPPGVHPPPPGVHPPME